MDEFIQESLENYQLVEIMQNSCFSRVYLAKCLQSSRHVILKVFDKPDTLCGIKEINATKQLKHDNVVQYVDSGQLSEFIDDFGDVVLLNYLVVQHYPNGNLYDYIAATGRFSEELARYYIKQLASAL